MWTCISCSTLPHPPLIILCKAEHFPLGIQNLIQNTCQDMVERRTIASRPMLRALGGWRPGHPRNGWPPKWQILNTHRLQQSSTSGNIIGVAWMVQSFHRSNPVVLFKEISRLSVLLDKTCLELRICIHTQLYMQAAAS